MVHMQLHKSIAKILILLLSSYLIFRLINVSQMLVYYPLGSELVTQITQLFFLKECGFYSFCPYWYGGIKTFLITPPGWYFFAMPFYIATGNILFATYTTLILSIVVSFSTFVYFGKLVGLSKIRVLLFFTLVFGNNIIIKTISFIRIHELFTWTIFFICTFIVLYYLAEKRKLDHVFLICTTVLYTFAILSHQSIGILLTFVLAGVAFYKRGIEKLKAITLMVVSVILTSFWWVPYLRTYLAGEISLHPAVIDLWSYNALDFSIIASVLLPATLVISFFLAWRTKSLSQDFVKFLTPTLVLSIIFVSGLVAHLPLLRNVSTYMYFTYFIFFSVFFFLKIKSHNNKSKKLFIICCSVVVLLSISISIVATPLFFVHGQNENDAISLAPSIEGKYIFVGELPYPLFRNAYYGYATIYYSKSTPDGWITYAKPKEYMHLLGTFKQLDTSSCNTFLENSQSLGLNNFIAYDKTCKTLFNCGLKEIKAAGNFCLYSIN